MKKIKSIKKKRCLELFEKLKKKLFTIKGIDRLEKTGSFIRGEWPLKEMDILIFIDSTSTFDKVVEKMKIKFVGMRHIKQHAFTFFHKRVKTNIYCYGSMFPALSAAAKLYCSSLEPHWRSLEKEFSNRGYSLLEFGVFKANIRQDNLITAKAIYEMAGFPYHKPSFRGEPPSKNIKRLISEGKIGWEHIEFPKEMEKIPSKKIVRKVTKEIEGKDKSAILLLGKNLENLESVSKRFRRKAKGKISIKPIFVTDKMSKVKTLDQFSICSCLEPKTLTSKKLQKRLEGLSKIKFPSLKLLSFPEEEAHPTFEYLDKIMTILASKKIALLVKETKGVWNETLIRKAKEKNVKILLLTSGDKFSKKQQSTINKLLLTKGDLVHMSSL